MLDATIRVLLEKKFGKPIRYPKDCEALAAIICETTGYQLSASTLKRALGFYKAVETPRLYTLDTIAIFLGFHDWADAQAHLSDSPPESQLLKNQFQGLSSGVFIKVTYAPDSTVVLKSNGHDHFDVIKSNCLHLMVGDLVQIPSLVVNHPLVCSKVIRGNVNIGQSIGNPLGSISALTHYQED